MMKRVMGPFLALAVVVAALHGCGGKTGTASRSSLTFGASMRISEGTANIVGNINGDGLPKRSMAVFGDNAYVTWWDDRDGDVDIWFARSTDGGKTFSANVKLSRDTSGALQLGSVLSADAAGNVYVVWEDLRDDPTSGKDIYIAVSTDFGRSFTESPLVVDPGPQGNPTVSAKGAGEVLVAWEDILSGNVYLTRSADRGATFEPPRPIFDIPIPFSLLSMTQVAAVGQSALFAFQGRLNGVDTFDQIYLAKLDNVLDAAMFASVIKVNDDTDPGTRHEDPSMIALANGTIYLVWGDSRNDVAGTGRRDLFLARSADGGSTFGPNRMLNDVPGTVTPRPSVHADPAGGVFVAWRDARNGNWDIFGSRSIDGGVTFGGNVRVDDDPTGQNQANPIVFIDNVFTCYAIWEDPRNPIGIYFALGQ